MEKLMTKIVKLNFYSKANCPQCSSSARSLKTNGIAEVEGRGINVKPVAIDGVLPIEVIRVDEDLEALQRIKEAGFTSAPVLEFINEEGEVEIAFSGFNPDQIKAVAEEIKKQ